jgi:hypothetical protein
LSIKTSSSGISSSRTVFCLSFSILWQSSNIWERHYQIKITLVSKSRADWIQGMPAAIGSSYFVCLFLRKSIRINTYRTNFVYCCLLCEHWEKHRLRVSRTRVLQLGFGPQTEEIRGESILLYNGELHDP